MLTQHVVLSVHSLLAINTLNLYIGMYSHVPGKFPLRVSPTLMCGSLYMLHYKGSPMVAMGDLDKSFTLIG